MITIYIINTIFTTNKQFTISQNHILFGPVCTHWDKIKTSLLGAKKKSRSTIRIYKTLLLDIRKGRGQNLFNL